MALRGLSLLCLAGAALGQDRYWGSYTASYPAGGGTTGPQEPWAQAARAQEPRAQVARAQEPRAQAARALEHKGRPQAAPIQTIKDTSSYQAALAEVEPGQYVHNPDWDLTPFQLWKRRQAAKGGAVQPAVAGPNRLVQTVRKQKQRPLPARTSASQTPARPRGRRPAGRLVETVRRQQQNPRVGKPPQPRFQNFRPVENRQPVPAQPARTVAFRNPGQYNGGQGQAVQPAYTQPTYAQPAYAQPAYAQPRSSPASGGVLAYPRAQHQTYTPEYIFEANNNAQRIYSYQAVSSGGLEYGAQAHGETYSYQASY